MKRYIDVDKIELKGIALFDENLEAFVSLSDVRKAIAQTPTADVVEVVRCKDCKFWGITHANDIEKSHYCCRDNMWCMPIRFADDFCSYGKRKEL